MLFQLLLSLGLIPTTFAKVQYLGVAISGGELGCQTDGTCNTTSVQFPSDSTGQINHFINDDGMNLIRLPVSWQYLVNNDATASMNDTNFGKYDQLIQACLNTGAYCMLELHNFARWNGAVIGQGGPTDDQFVAIWRELALSYAGYEKIVFELMEEPHDLNINTWAQTCQKAVTAIREVGATSQMILLPGTDYDSADTLTSDGSAAALMAITNLDGTTDNLILDIHKYLDSDNSGTHAECVTDNIDSLTTVAGYLRQNGRKGFISESGAGNTASCLTKFCAQNAFINKNSDVFLGFAAWAAGSFGTSDVLSLLSTKQNGQYEDNEIMTQCVLGTWSSNSTSTGTNSSISSSAPSSMPASSFAPSTFTTKTATGINTGTATGTFTGTVTGTASQTNNGTLTGAATKTTTGTAAKITSTASYDEVVDTATMDISEETTLDIATATPVKASSAALGLNALQTAAASSAAAAASSAAATPSSRVSGAVSFAVRDSRLWFISVLAAGVIALA